MKLIPPLQKARAAALRVDATEAERRLWRHLRQRQLGGHKFSRQIAIGPYIADLVCRSQMLIVEVDGGQHGGADDIRRQGVIEALGYRVLRFWNNDVLANTDGVLLSILAALEKSPPPAPPVPGGEQIEGGAQDVS